MGTLKKGDHFITSSYEHPAILNVIPFLKKTGVSISLIKPNKGGLVEPLKIKNEINSKNPEGRVIIRPSGTEPLIRISIENKDQDVASTLAKDIINAIKENG